MAVPRISERKLGLNGAQLSDLADILDEAAGLLSEVSSRVRADDTVTQIALAGARAKMTAYAALDDLTERLLSALPELDMGNGNEEKK